MFFDDIIESSLYNSFTVTHYKVTVVGLDADGRPSWDTSTKVTSAFNALWSVKTTSRWVRDNLGNQISHDGILEIPSHIIIDEFSHEDMKDRLKIGDIYYEAIEIHDDTMFDLRYLEVAVRKLVGVI